MGDCLNEIVKAIVDEVKAKKIVIYGEKKNGECLREASLLIVVEDEPKEAEKRLYRVLDMDIALNLLVYKENDFCLLMEDKTSYAYSIMSKGRVLYG